MKLWEAMKLLEENPTDVYEAKMNEGWKARMTVKAGFGGYYNFEVFKGKRLVNQSFNDNVALDLDWQLVQQPVTWQEAIEARADGKRVRCEFNDRSWGVAELVANHLYFRAALDDGKWYVGS